MSAKRCRVGMVDVTMTAGVNSSTGTGNWRDPDTIRATSPTQIELEYSPDIVIVHRSAGTVGNMGEITAAVTAAGVTLTGANNLDDGTIRVTGICRADDLGVL